MSCPAADTKYYVSEVYPTIQGEGLMTGTPCTLVRLAGCTVGCSWCDTPYAWKQESEAVSAMDIVGKWKLVREGSSAVLLTGGEPGEQDLRELVSYFVGFGASLMLETSGTATGWLGCANQFDHICLSPKLGIKEPLLECLQWAGELKFVIGQLTVSQIVEFLDKNRRIVRGIPVSVQPQSGMTEYKQQAIEAARRQGWRLSLQTHKLLGLP